MLERPESRQFHANVIARCELSHAQAPMSPAFGASVLEHAGMQQYKLHLRKILREPCGVRLLTCKHLQLEQESALLELTQSATPCSIVHDIGSRGKTVQRFFVPMQLLAYAAQIRARLLSIERCADVRRCKIRAADDTLRKPVPVGDGLHPFNF